MRRCSRSTPMVSRTYNPRAVAITLWAKSAKTRQSRDSFLSAGVEHATWPRNPKCYSLLREDGTPLIHEPLSALLAFKSRQARNTVNLLRSCYLQPAPLQT